MAIATNPQTGETMVLDDNLSDDQVRAAISSASLRKSQTGNRSSLVANLASALQNTQASGEADVPQSTLPQGLETGAGLTPEQTGALLQQQQRSNESVVAQKAQQRQTVVEQLEAEKDRAQEVKLEQQRFKNEQATQKLRAEQAETQAKLGSTLRREEDEVSGLKAQRAAATESAQARTTQIERTTPTEEQAATQMDAQTQTALHNAARAASESAISLYRQQNPGVAEEGGITELPAKAQEFALVAAMDTIQSELALGSPQFQAAIQREAYERAKEKYDNLPGLFGFGHGEPTQKQIAFELAAIEPESQQELLNEVMPSFGPAAQTQAISALYGINLPGGAAPGGAPAAAQPGPAATTAPQMPEDAVQAADGKWYRKNNQGGWNLIELE